jgi:hypothetical protein
MCLYLYIYSQVYDGGEWLSPAFSGTPLRTPENSSFEEIADDDVEGESAGIDFFGQSTFGNLHVPAVDEAVAKGPVQVRRRTLLKHVFALSSHFFLSTLMRLSSFYNF